MTDMLILGGLPLMGFRGFWFSRLFVQGEATARHETVWQPLSSLRKNHHRSKRKVKAHAN
jgi:hypothetical protein